MRKAKMFFFWAFFCPALQACSQPGELPAAGISGTLQASYGWKKTLYLAKPRNYKQWLATYQMQVVDSAQLDDQGNFHFQVPMTEGSSGLYALLCQRTESRFQNLIETNPASENYIAILLEPGADIQLQANTAQLTHSNKFLRSNAVTDQLAQLQQLRKPLTKIPVVQDSSPSQASLEEEYTLHEPSLQVLASNAALDAFLDTCLSPLSLFTALRLRAPVHDFRDRPEFFLSVLGRLQKSAADQAWTKELTSLLSPGNLPVLIGEPMPGFSLPTPKGDTLTLAGLKGKLILVDFWASWCAPCRKETRYTIRPLYDAYHQQGFEVLGISIDSDRNAWLNAINKDGAIWLHASDLEGDASPVRQSLKFETIPACYLLDAEGKLLARNLHGEELKKFVDGFFGK